MKMFSLFIISNLIGLIFSVLPIWNLKDSSVDLLPENTNQHSYIFTEKNYQMKAQLKKTITRSGSTITKTNLMYSETIGVTQNNVDYEDIESVCVLYSDNNKYVICPNGKYHPIYYYNNNNNLNTLYAGGIDNSKDWSLKCYKHDTGFIFVFYLNYGINFYYTAKPTENLNGRNHFDEINNIFDFKLNNGNSGTYAMAAIVQRTNGDLSLIGTHLSLNTNNGDSGFTGSHNYIKLTDAKAHTKACFKSDNYFYYFTYNNASDFIGGYSTGAVSDSDYSNINGIGFHTFEESPFELINEVEIQEINFIKTTKYVYFKIKDLTTEKIYYGILDIGWNRVIFNTDETIEKYTPYSDISMLAITSETAYEICVLKSDGSCTSSCSNSNEGLILDIEMNKCGTECEIGKIEMLPEHVCMNPIYCDTSKYIKNDTHCGLCKYFYPDDNKYTFIKNTKIDCLNSIPEWAEEYNSKSHLLRCKSGYKLENDECVTDCYLLCNTCSEHSNDETSQKCLTCKDGYSLDEETKNCKKIVSTTIMTEPSTELSAGHTTEHISVYSTQLTTEPSTELSAEHTTEHISVDSTELPNLPPTEEEVICPNEKCLTCNTESNKLDLCLTCNEDKGYKKVNYTIIYIQYLDCIKEDNSKLINFYYNETVDQYRPCYKTCKRCLLGGSPEAHNCLECADNYMFRPGDNPYNNCVAYSEFYYMSAYNQYKGLNIFQCPEEAKYAIKDKKMCIDDCSKDNVYKYLFNGNCVKECPSGTTKNNNICKVNSDKCSFGENELILDEKQDLSVINSHIKNFISEFNYTEKHISLYKNKIYSIMIYKTSDCIEELSLDMPKVNFQSCYEKVQLEYGITEKLIIVIVDKIQVNNPTTYYSFYHPKSGFKLNAEEICKDDTIVVLENLVSVLDKNDTYYEIQSSLTSQGINIFDINDPFYTGICYDFDNELKKDIPLNDRITTIFPNATLCDKGCQYEGINLNDMTAECNCKFNDITNNNAIKDNALLDSALGEVLDLVNSSNILVFKCIKNIFKHFSRSIGGWISIGLIASHIGLTLIFAFIELSKIKTYMISLTKNFLSFLSQLKVKHFPPKKNIKKNKSKVVHENKDIKIKKENISLYEGNSKIKNKNNIKNKNINLKSNEYLIIDEKVKEDEFQDKKFFEDYLSTAPDDMEFDDAIAKDKRSFGETFVENLKDNQIIVNTFFAEEPLKVRSIKIILFILNIMLYFVVNGLFFSEEVISELYNVDKEKENFFSFIPRSIERLIYTTLVGIIVGIITDFFFIEEIKIQGIFKRDKDDKKLLKNNITNLFKDIKKRNISFIIIVSILLMISAIYLLCFNYVYPYSQIEWIKSSISIIIIMQVLSFLRCLFETCLRFLSFITRSEKIYKIAKLLD